MQLHQLPGRKRAFKKRVGRGGKRGTFSGRGTKGQKSRAGRRIRPAGRDLVMRIPKRRGFRNKPLEPKPLVINLEDLAKKITSIEGEGTLRVNKDLLRKLRILRTHYRGEVKILGQGEITVPLTIEGLQVSESAKAKIERAGGVIQKVQDGKSKARDTAKSKQ